MALVIIIFGVLMVIAGAWLVAQPAALFDLLRKHSEALALHVFAVVVRMILGALLVLSANDSLYPAAMEILGWVILAAAIMLAVMGRGNFKKLMAWALSLNASLQRIAGTASIGFGGFLVYAFS